MIDHDTSIKRSRSTLTEKIYKKKEKGKKKRKERKKKKRRKKRKKKGRKKKLPSKSDKVKNDRVLRLREKVVKKKKPIDGRRVRRPSSPTGASARTAASARRERARRLSARTERETRANLPRGNDDTRARAPSTTTAGELAFRRSASKAERDTARTRYRFRFFFFLHFLHTLALRRAEVLSSRQDEPPSEGQS